MKSKEFSSYDKKMSSPQSTYQSLKSQWPDLCDDEEDDEEEGHHILQTKYLQEEGYKEGETESNTQESWQPSWVAGRGRQGLKKGQHTKGTVSKVAKAVKDTSQIGSSNNISSCFFQQQFQSQPPGKNSNCNLNRNRESNSNPRLDDSADLLDDWVMANNSYLQRLEDKNKLTTDESYSLDSSETLIWKALNCVLADKPQRLKELFSASSVSDQPSPGLPKLDLTKPVFDKGRTLLMMATLKSNEDLLSLILQKEPVLLDFQDFEGRSALHYAAKYRRLVSLAWLLRQQAQVDVEDKNGQTPLHLAAEASAKARSSFFDKDTSSKNYKEVCFMLAGHGASLEKKDFRGMTPLCYLKDQKLADQLKIAFGKKDSPSDDIINEVLVEPASTTARFNNLRLKYLRSRGIKAAFISPFKMDQNNHGETIYKDIYEKNNNQRNPSFSGKKEEDRSAVSCNKFNKSKIEGSPNLLKSLPTFPEDPNIAKNCLNSTTSIFKSSTNNSSPQSSLQSQKTDQNPENLENPPISSISSKDFLISDILGSGAFGRVFCCKKITEIGDNSTKEPKWYALKEFNKRQMLGQSLQKLLQTEKKIMMNFDHPFIPKIYHAFQTKRLLFLTMDYCKYRDLGYYLKKNQKMDEIKAKLLIAEVILAVEALHSKGFVHRDIKPDNILISADGHIKLADFGCSQEINPLSEPVEPEEQKEIKDLKLMKETSQKILCKKSVKAKQVSSKLNTQMSSPSDLLSTFCGSRDYLPPEMLLKTGHNKTIDWYLVGQLLYEAVVGKPPYAGGDRKTVFASIKGQNLIFPKSIDISDSCKDIIYQLMTTSIEKRLGHLGAQSVKSHPFFLGLDWNRVFDKRYTLFRTEELDPYVLRNLDHFIGDDNSKGSKPGLHVPNWSFSV